VEGKDARNTKNATKSATNNLKRTFERWFM
jgi:hypothetical protein